MSRTSLTPEVLDFLYNNIKWTTQQEAWRELILTDRANAAAEILAMTEDEFTDFVINEVSE